MAVVPDGPVERRAAPAEPRRTAIRSAVEGLALAAVLVAVLRHFAVPPTAHPDSVADFLAARDCIENHLCLGRGPGSSLASFVHGALWIHFLEAALALGLSAIRIQQVCLALWVAAALVVFTAGRRRLALDLAGASAILLVLLLLRATTYPVLWLFAITALPVALHHALLVAAVATGGTAWFAGAGAALALAISAHVSCAPLLLPFVAVVVAASRVPARAISAALAGLAALLLLESPAMLVDNAIALGRSGLVLPALLAFFAAAGAGLLLRPAALRAGPTARARAAVWGCLLAGAGGVALVHLRFQRPLDERYLVGFLPAIAWAPVMLLEWIAAAFAGTVGEKPPATAPTAHAGGSRRALSRLLVGVACAGGLVAVGRTVAPRYDEWSLPGVEALARHLRDGGWTWPDVQRHLRGPQSWKLISALGAWLPDASVHRFAPAAPRDDLVAVEVARAALPSLRPPGWEVVEVDGRRAVVLRSVRPWVDRRSFQVCRERADGSRGECVDAAVPAPMIASFHDRQYPAIPEIERAAFYRGLGGDERLVYRIPIVVPDGAGAARRLSVCGARGWSIRAVDGVVTGGALPSESVTVDGTRPARGTLEITFRGRPAQAWPPEILELDFADAPLAALFSAADGAHCFDPHH